MVLAQYHLWVGNIMATFSGRLFHNQSADLTREGGSFY